MKACPICAAKAFDDAEVCFGCLHRFEAGSAGPRSADVPLAPVAPTGHPAPAPIAPSAACAEPAEAGTRAIGDGMRAESDAQGWTVTFELPGIVVGQDPSSAIAGIEAVGRAGAGELSEERGVPRSACSVVVRVAAPLFEGECRSGHNASPSARAPVRCGDGRGTHARERRPDGLAASKAVEGGA